MSNDTQNLNRSSLARSGKLEEIFIVTLCIVLVVNIIKPLLDFYWGIENKIVTIFQFIILLLFYLIKKTRIPSLSPLEWLFLFYMLMRYLIEILAFNMGLFQPTVSFLKFIILILGINFFINHRYDERFYQVINRILWIYFMFTILISVLQYTDSNLGVIFSTYGGNIMSGNFFGITRCTGGIGGTVIDYSMLIILYALLFTTYKSKGTTKFTYISSLVIASFLVFSRVVFLVFLLLLAFYFLQNILILKKVKPLLILCTSSIVILIFLSVFYDYIKIFLVYDPASSTSDGERINQWKNVWEDLGKTSYFIGNSMGRNTGIPGHEFGGRLLVSDGHFQGFLSDYGFIGLFLYVMYLISSTYKAINNKKETLIFVFILFTVLTINSGFDKHFNIFMFPIMLYIVKQNFIKYERNLN